MNIMIINHYAGSEGYGMEFRPYYIGRELVKLGHDVTVIAADCSHLRKKNPIIEKSFTEEMLDGVRYVFVKTTKYKKNNLKRFLNMFSFLNQLKINSKMLYKKYRPDVIIASSTYLYDVKAAKRIAEYNKNVRVCYEIHDIWPLSLVELYKLSVNNPYIKSLQRAEIYAYENSDFIVSILPHVNKHIAELGFDDINYTYIPNGVVIDDERQKDAPEFIKKEIDRLKSGGKFVVMYLGGFSKANALEDLLESAALVSGDIQIMLVGDGPLRRSLAEAVKAKEYGNVSLMPSVNKDAVQGTLRLADALYIGAKRSGLYRYGVGMNKIFDYMLAAKPIIYGIEASNDIVGDARCGLTIKPENANAIAEAAETLKQMGPVALAVMGQNGYKYVVENHDYQKLAEKLLNVINEHRSKLC